MSRTFKSYRKVRVSIVRERAVEPYEVPAAVKEPADIARLVRAMVGDDPREHFVAIYLDGKHKPIGAFVASIGTANTAPVSPGEIFLPAVALGATALVVAHNHPSGDPTPSIEDCMVTDRLRAAGKLLSIELLDHVVIGSEKGWSFSGERTFALEVV